MFFRPIIRPFLAILYGSPLIPYGEWPLRDPGRDPQVGRGVNAINSYSIVPIELLLQRTLSAG